MLSVARYSVKCARLAPWIKFLWYCEAENINVHYKLLPTDSIDVILNLSSGIIYEDGSRRISAPPFHINGLRNKHSYIQQTGNIRIFGISFCPFGLYPFVNKSLSGISDGIVDLHELSLTLAQSLESATSSGIDTESIIGNIEKSLLPKLQVTEDYVNKAKLIRDYLEADSNITIQAFCAEHGVHTKTFLRNALHYTGYTPKILHSIKRFQKAGNQLIYQNPGQLSDIAYDNDFADQAHFIREFRRFSGIAPRAFQHDKNTVKENVEYLYR